MTATVDNQGFLARLRAGAKRIIEAICPCLKKPKTDEDSPEDDIDITPPISTECSSTATTEKSVNLNQSATEGMFSVPVTVHTSEIFVQRYPDVSSSAEPTASDTHFAVQHFTGSKCLLIYSHTFFINSSVVYIRSSAECPHTHNYTDIYIYIICTYM
uniref:Uncharacterized protein n=1 Tax=Octopus bimaculoides TaxID=37653 RepID=A0A0L8ID84_OCTBM